jgi:Starch-binding associating with outer membrane
MKNIIKFAILLLILGFTASCSEDYLDVNTDPNNPTAVTPDLVLPVAQLYSARGVQEYRGFSHFGNMMMYNWSQSDGYNWYNEEFKYLVTSSFYQDLFEESYSLSLKQYEVLNNLEDSKYDYYKAISKIMKAFHYQLVVDTYGDVPYSEALGRSLNPTPKYDDAQTIYNDLIVELTAAIALIDNATAQDAPGEDDVMFGGDMLKWKQFANTVKLRILVRQSDMSGRADYINTEIAAINADGSGYITTDVAVNPVYVAESGKQNPMWNGLGADASGTQTMSSKATCASDYVLAYLTSKNDPRIDRLYEKPTDGHLGVPQGMKDYDTPVVDAFVPEKVSNIGPGILKSAEMDAVIFTLAESYFNMAELADKGFISAGDGGQSMYESGITASFLYLDLTAAQATSYYSQGLVGWTSATNKQEAIITQKWIAVNGITAEQSWFDYNRTGFPTGLPISLLATTPDRPVRLMYVASELSANGANVPAQPDAFTAKVFWAN